MSLLVLNPREMWRRRRRGQCQARAASRGGEGCAQEKRESESERERDRERQGETGRDSERVCVVECEKESERVRERRGSRMAKGARHKEQGERAEKIIASLRNRKAF